MARGYTLDELLKMGAKPVAPQGGLTRDQLLQQGATPYDPRDSLVAHYKAPEAPKKSFLTRLKDIGGALISSERTFGKGLSTVFDTTSQKTVSDVATMEQSGQQQLINAIHKESNPLKKEHLVQTLKKIYGVPFQPTAGDLNEGYNLTTGQVLGAAGGTLLDIALAGSYGKAATGAETGKLLTKSQKLANLASKVGIESTIKPPAQAAVKSLVKPALSETLKSIGKKTAERTAVGAATGYGYDVTGALQQGKTGKEAFKPRLGTYLGGGIPLAIGGIEAGVAITKDLGPRLINSLVKPRQSNFAYGKNPGRAVSEMGITGNNLEDFGNNVKKARQEVGQQIGDVISNVDKQREYIIDTSLGGPGHGVVADEIIQDAKGNLLPEYVKGRVDDISHKLEDQFGKEASDKFRKLVDVSDTSIEDMADAIRKATSIDATDEIAKIDQAINKAAKGGKNNQGIVNTLNNIKDSLLYDHKVAADGTIVRVGDSKDLSALSAAEAFDLKQKIAEATQFTGNPSDDKAVNSLLKSLYGGTKDKLNETLSQTNPEILKLNERYGDLTSAALAIEHRDQILQRANIKGLSDTAAAGAGALTELLLTGGHIGIGTALASATGVAIEKAASSTAVKTRIAAWLSSETPSTIQKVIEKNPQIRTFLLRTFPKFASKLGEQ
jgi:hypothetical protein